MSDNLVLIERKEHVLTLSLNRPERHHALGMELCGRLLVAVRTAETDDQVRVIVLTGTGDKAFCAGADMLETSGVESQSSNAPKANAGEVIAAFSQTPLPVIAAVNGYCYGGGAALAVACDLRIASSNATFRLPGAEYGLVVAAATLPRLVGAAKAKELIFTARKFNADEADACGFVNSVCEQSDLMPTAIEMAEAIAANSVAAVRGIQARSLTLRHCRPMQ